jgi:DNA-binding response OmpR family regulator
LCLINLAEEIPDELTGWAGKRYDVVAVDDPLRLVTKLQDGDSFGVILIYVDRAHTEDAAEACRAVRPFTIAPIILAADDRLRAADRTAALDAGANDFLSDNFAMAELASRIDRAAQSVRGLAPPRRSSEQRVGKVPSVLLNEDLLSSEIHERLEASDGSIFTLVLIRKSAIPEELLGDALLQQLRGDVGDIAGLVGGGFGVVLQGARPNQADAFLGRLKKALQSEAVMFDNLDVQVFNSASEPDRIVELLKSKGEGAAAPSSGP